MFAKGKKIFSVEYKEKLLAQIAHYEGRIEEALNKPIEPTFQDESSDEDNYSNPYKLDVQQSVYELKQQEASLSDRASFTLELALLTIMQSEVNVMVTPPELRRPVQEDGVWLEVVAECKIDLVSFTITFYAHKPHRRFAPVCYRNVVVQLVKSAHEKELSQSVLSKLNRPYLAVQVLQSYATAFRSRRTTLLELAEKYADKLRMEAMPEGGYRIKFLNLLQVDWTLENMWSPIVPFCHRMKFEVEYMPKEYIHAISKLYKQFKDPALETAERTLVLCRILDTCLRAQGLQESDEDTAGHLSGSRTTIDQEPDVPSIEHSPKKPKGKENKVQNKKTSMAPPKTIPKKAKKVISRPSDKNVVENRKITKNNVENDTSNDVEKNNEKDDVVDNRKGVKRAIEDEGNNVKKSIAKDAESKKGSNIITEKDNEKTNENEAVLENRKGSKRVVENDADDNAKKSKAKGVVAENRKGVKRAIENDGNNDAKKSKTDEVNTTSKSKAGLKGGKNGIEDGGQTESNNLKSSRDTAKLDVNDDDEPRVSSKSNAHKYNSDKVTSTKETDKTKKTQVQDNIKKGDGKASSEKSKKNTDTTKGTKKKDIVKNVDNVIDENTAQTQAGSKKVTQKGNAKNKENDTIGLKYINTDDNDVNSKNSENSANLKKVAIKVNTKIDEGSVAGSNNGKTVISKNKPVKGEDHTNATSKEKQSANLKKVNDTQNNKQVSSGSAPSKDNDVKVQGTTKENRKGDAFTKKVAKDVNEANAGGKLKTQVIDKTKDQVTKKPTHKESNTVNVVKKVANKGGNVEITKNNIEKVSKLKETGKVIKNKTTKNNENIEKIKGTAKQAEKNAISAKINSIDVNKNKKSVEKASTIITQKVNNHNILAKKSKIIQSDNIKHRDKINIDENHKSNTEKTKSKLPENSTGKVLKEKSNRDETVRKVTEKNKIKILSNITIQKADPNLLNVTVTKPKSIAISKIKPETQIKLADKLKTKIPMMKSKMKFSTLNERVLPSNIRISKGVETKIPLKSLPVFKKVVKNMPTRFSPRKFPTTFKPSSHGFSNK